MTPITPNALRLPGLRRGVAVTSAALVVAGLGPAVAAPAPAAAEGVHAKQSLVAILHTHVARTRPSVHAHRIETVPARRPLTRIRTVLPVLGHATSSDRRHWVQVRLPGRPNSHKGWILSSDTRRAATGWHISIRLSQLRVIVYFYGRVERRFAAVVGKSSTPTPRGEFFIEEPVALAGQVGGPFALATSARSNVFQEFEGGPGQVAIHGTNGLSDPPGTAASHGCVRLTPSDITWLVRRIGAGVPLTITL